MKALRWHGRKDLRLEDIPEPVPGTGEVKIKVSMAGICGTDLKEYSSGPCIINPEKVPVTVGHEFAGTVVELGDNIKNLKPGDRVAGVGYWVCGECYYCKRHMYNVCSNLEFTGLHKNGCMADYLVSPEYALYKLPDTVSDEAGALVEPIAVSIHAARISKMALGDRTAIVGDGIIGLCTLLAVKAAGASEVHLIAKHKGRGERALSMGVSTVTYMNETDPVEAIKGFTDGLGVDVAFECVGRPETPQLALNLIRNGGTVVIEGVFDQPGQVNFLDIMYNQKNIIGSPIYIDEGATAVSLLADGTIDAGKLITSVVPLEEAVEQGFEQLLSNKEDNIKVIVKI
ncbi:MAG: 2,3-butanediol dehydrogenase [Dehalococcoidales bacterium]|nr:2,3-butanediol dehydrogenase [Dehalococcoidales bacterium]